MKTILAVATYSGKLTAKLAEFVARRPPDWKFVGVKNARPIEWALNMICAAFLRSDCEDLLIIEDDVDPCGELYRIGEIDGDIIVPECPVLTIDLDGPILRSAFYVRREKLAALPNRPSCGTLCGYASLDPLDDTPAPATIDGSQMTAVLIRRRVIEDRRVWNSPQWTNEVGDLVKDDQAPFAGTWIPDVFNTPRGVAGREQSTQDLPFYARAVAAGYRIVPAPQIVVDHYQSVTGTAIRDVIRRALRSHGSPV